MKAALDNVNSDTAAFGQITEAFQVRVCNRLICAVGKVSEHTVGGAKLT